MGKKGKWIIPGVSQGLAQICFTLHQRPLCPRVWARCSMIRAQETGTISGQRGVSAYTFWSHKFKAV